MNPSANQSDTRPDESAEDTRAARFIANHTGWLSRYVRWLGCPQADADDLLQDVFVAVLQARSEPRGERQVRSYLRETARRLSFARGRRKRREFEVIDDATAVTLFDAAEAERGPRLEALRRCLGELPRRQNAALREFYGEGRSRREVATRLGLALGGVKTLLERTRNRLRACIDRRLTEEEFR